MRNFIGSPLLLSIYLSIVRYVFHNPHLENQRNSSVSHLVALRFAQATDTICKERLRNYVNQRISLSRLIRFIVRQQPPSRDRNSISNIYIYTYPPFPPFLSFLFFSLRETERRRTAGGNMSFHRIDQQQVILTRFEDNILPLSLSLSLFLASFRKRTIFPKYISSEEITKESRTKKPRGKKSRNCILLNLYYFAQTSQRSVTIVPFVARRPPPSPRPCSSIFLEQVIVGSWKLA